MNTKQQKADYEAKKYLLNAIDSSDYDDVERVTDKDKLQFIADTFMSEYGFNIKRYGSYQRALAEWFMGLPSSINIDYQNYRILELSKEWGCLEENASEKDEDKIIEGWFLWMSNKLMKLFSMHGIKVR